jgi:hypothetical protein
MLQHYTSVISRCKHAKISACRGSDYEEPAQREGNMSPRLHYIVRSTNRRLYSKMSEPLVSLPAVQKLSDRVIRVLGGNPSKVRNHGKPGVEAGRNPNRPVVHAARHKHIHRRHRLQASADRHRRREGGMDRIDQIYAERAQDYNRQSAALTLASRPRARHPRSLVPQP